MTSQKAQSMKNLIWKDHIKTNKQSATVNIRFTRQKPSDRGRFLEVFSKNQLTEGLQFNGHLLQQGGLQELQSVRPR